MARCHLPPSRPPSSTNTGDNHKNNYKNIILDKDITNTYSFEWSLSMIAADFLQSSIWSCMGRIMQSRRAAHKVFIRDSIDLCRMTILVRQAPMSRVAPEKNTQESLLSCALTNTQSKQSIMMKNGPTVSFIA